MLGNATGCLGFRIVPLRKKEATSMEHPLYKPLEAARLLGISKEMLLSYERDGVIPPSERDAAGNRIYTPEDVQEIRHLIGIRPTLPNAPAVIAVFNMKGGVGKSTVSSNLAWKFAEYGYRTLAVDADPQGHMTTSLGQEPAEFEKTLLELIIPDTHRKTASARDLRCTITSNLDLIPANLSMCSLNLLLFQQPEREYRLRRAIDDIRRSESYDVIVIDSPPAYDLTSLNILLACTVLLAPVKLDGNSFYGLEYLFDSVRDISETYRYDIPLVSIVPNHYNSSYSVSRQILEGLRKNYGPYLARTVIRQDVNFDKANALRQPVFLTSPSCKGSGDLERLTTEILNVLRTENLPGDSDDPEEETRLHEVHEKAGTASHATAIGS
jgi:chromosome partitioning protein